MLKSNFKGLTAMIIDDEPLAHDVLLHHLRGQSDIKVIAQCYNATQALQHLVSTPVDLMFLDINMPALTGIDMLRVIGKKPQVIIVTAYPEYALEGFELDVTDYLMKPVGQSRFRAALDKVRKRYILAKSANTQSQPIEESITIKTGRGTRKFLCDDIIFLEAYGNYVKCWELKRQSGVETTQMTLVNSTLKSLMQTIPTDTFIQTHKSFVVNIKHIKARYSDHVELTCNSIAKIGKSYKKRLVDLIR